MAKLSRIAGLFKIGTSGEHIQAGFEYLIKHHHENPALYPLSFAGIKVTGDLFGQVYEIIYMGDLKSTGIYCDTLTEKFSTNHQLVENLPKSFLTDLDNRGLQIRLAKTIATKAEATALLESIDKVYHEDLGVTESEIENWVNDFYAICTVPNRKATRQVSLAPPDFLRGINIDSKSSLSDLVSFEPGPAFTPLKNAKRISEQKNKKDVSSNATATRNCCYTAMNKLAKFFGMNVW